MNVKKNGFTLLELLTVIAILSVIAVLLLLSFSGIRVKARDTRRIVDLTNIRTALELYYFDNDYYPAGPAGYDPLSHGDVYRSNDIGWLTLRTELEDYISLPADPLNDGNPEVSEDNHAYVYGNVFRFTHPPQYDLYAGFEDTLHPKNCASKAYGFFHNNKAMCKAWVGSFDVNDLYEISEQRFTP